MKKNSILIISMLLFNLACAWGGAFVITIKEIKSSPQYLNSLVEIKGKFKGWQSKIGAPPVTRSDYIIEDETGQIYVSGRLPQGISKNEIGKEIKIKARVKSKDKNVYLQI